MLATFIIGLREGLEAALIVGIIAAFLKRNGRSLTPMLVGVAAAILLSLGVGIGLKLVEQSLPQAAQEGMEAVIGIVAIVFVTSMVVWMQTNSRGLKRELEGAAGAALGQGSTRALVLMAFLAVLKEGFETAVFLLATFSASGNATLAATGAVLGIIVSAGIGYGLYTGGMKLNLGRFFALTSVFLVLVAAGLVVNTLGTMREAGWLNAGQARVVDLSWLAAPGSIQGALLTGVLGIPPYPNVVQVVGWFAYLIPMCCYLYWPRQHRPSGQAVKWLRLAISGALVVGAAAMFFAFRGHGALEVDSVTVVDQAGAQVGTVTSDGVATVGRVTVSIPLTDGVPESHAGVPGAARFTTESAGSPGEMPTRITLHELVQLNGGRVPVGVNPQVAVGPFDVAWSAAGQQTIWLIDGNVLDFQANRSTTATLSGGGLPNPRILTVDGELPGGAVVATGQWQADPAKVAQTAAAWHQLRADAVESQFWGLVVPLALLIAALLTAVGARRRPDRQPGPLAEAPVPHPVRKLHVS